ncbi:hypothetical protein HTY52_22780 [Cupriavidus taiwanensis]|uniref:hypothetical protein n=1 Tax=Cupriavidus taiwanensis TaxID=164546 RepID=UPI001572104B|nr:hypothetical protein [Cupriavidus taiwanensis]NSX16921.1 hypothetical protein [Cupriavidus taiwanensis]
MTAAEYLHHVQETRRKRLIDLVATFESQGEAVREIGLSRQYVIGLMRGYRPFGERIARTIEGNFGLEFGALDRAMEG